jgi:predicted RND superfamily exporter protein
MDSYSSVVRLCSEYGCLVRRVYSCIVDTTCTHFYSLLKGVPFTSMTQILPFVIFGVGLDDAFIISGSYDRTDPKKEPEDRIHDTIEDIGISITLTTVTSTLAFGLGAISTIPTIYWLCYYAFPTIVFVYIYQLTFFVACIVLDEHRVQQNRRDCCTWITVVEADDDEEDRENQEASAPSNEPITERFMSWYAEHLLRPWVKVSVVFVFTALFCSCAYSASQLSQQFRLTDVIPDDSYLVGFFDALDDFSARSSTAPFVYFRNVDQSDESVQEQMENYINDLVTIDAIVDQPEFFWLRDFKSFLNVSEDSLAQLDFNDQVDAFLADPVYGDLHRDNIVRDEAGTITTSRCVVNMDNVDLEDVNLQIDALEDQRKVTKVQPINQGKKDWSFFTYDGVYNIWEFYSVSAQELALTTILGVVAVTGVAFLLIPHWTSALFVLPLIVVLYVDLLGLMQLAGIHVNPVSYIALVMSIGLLVDYVMHVLLRYYESSGNRKEKTVEMLKTMGASILIGGISTFLGTLPLAFSSSEIFSTIFITFVGLVVLGCAHGLILLPVILSTIGPEDQVRKGTRKSLEHQETAVTIVVDAESNA